MEVLLIRKDKSLNYTFGELYVNQKYICDTLEDTDRGLKADFDLKEIEKIKIKHKTAIPSGTYEINLNVYSPLFGQKAYYKSFCQGRVPRIMNVPGFSGILIHRGRTIDHTSGCILVGWRFNNDEELTDSQKAFEMLYKLLKEASDRKEKIFIKIV